MIDKMEGTPAMRQLIHLVLVLFVAVALASSASASELSEALKKGAVSATTTEEVSVRDAEPKQGFLFIDTGKKLFEINANTRVKIIGQMELKTLIGPAIYVRLTVKHPQTGQEITGWAWYGDSKKSQFKLLP
jgi:DNA-directed RNA polymerase subunit E'/Rpb7